MFKNILKTAWRNIVRQRVNTTINVLGLTLGITVCLIIFLLVKYELGFDRFHPDGSRIYRLVVTKIGGDEGSKGASGGGNGGRANKPVDDSIAKGEPLFGFLAGPVANDARKELSGLESVAGFNVVNSTVVVPQPAKGNLVFEPVPDMPSQIIIAQPQYFDIFKYHWLAGDAATALKDPFRVVLTENEAIRYFGRQDPDQWLGRKLVYLDSLEVSVSGIVADWKENSDFGFEDFISSATIHSSFLKGQYESNGWYMWDWDNYGMVKLAPGVTPGQVQRQLPAFSIRHQQSIQPGQPVDRIISLQPLADIHYNEKYSDAFSRKASLPTLYGLAAIAAFILLIAAVNFINLSTAQSVRRSREIGVRKVLGGRRGAIMLQFLSETLVLVLIASLIALLVANPLMAAFRSLLPRGVTLHVFQWPTAIFLSILTVVTCVLAGWYPARVLAAFQPVLSLKGQGIQQMNNKSYLRKALIVFQFTVSLIFIIGTLIVAKQIHFVLDTDMGFDHDAIVNVRGPWAGTPDLTAQKRNLLDEKFREIAGVKIVARSSETPLAQGHNGTVINTSDKYHGDDHDILASFDVIDTNYLRLYDMKLVAGRDLFPSDTIHEFLINETCSRQLGFGRPADALGKMVTVGMNNGHGAIVGVLKDFYSESMHEAIKPFFITTYTRSTGLFSVKLATAGQSAGHLSGVLAQMEKAFKQIYPGKKWEYQFFDEKIAKLYDKEQKLSKLLDIAMGIAIFISCLGLFGLAAFVAEQRTKEIGIRKVMGATVANIVAMLSRDFLRLVVLAILIASPIAWYFMHGWLQDFAYRVQISWWIYVVAGLAALGIALATVSFRAIRAGMMNPIESLRSE